MEEIISNITATTSIGKLNLRRIGLTKVPPGLTKFTTLSSLSISDNKIAAVRNGDLKLTSSTLMQLELGFDTELATIEDGSLPSKLTNQHRNALVIDTFY